MMRITFHRSEFLRIPLHRYTCDTLDMLSIHRPGRQLFCCLYRTDKLKLEPSTPEVIKRLDKPDKSEPRVGIQIYGARNEPTHDGF